MIDYKDIKDTLVDLLYHRHNETVKALVEIELDVNIDDEVWEEMYYRYLKRFNLINDEWYEIYTELTETEEED